jgi:hypothetical protein
VWRVIFIAVPTLKDAGGKVKAGAPLARWTR